MKAVRLRAGCGVFSWGESAESSGTALSDWAIVFAVQDDGGPNQMGPRKTIDNLYARLATNVGKNYLPLKIMGRYLGDE